jgi:hypothetical protein
MMTKKKKYLYREKSELYARLILGEFYVADALEVVLRPPGFSFLYVRSDLPIDGEKSYNLVGPRLVPFGGYRHQPELCDTDELWVTHFQKYDYLDDVRKRLALRIRLDAEAKLKEDGNSIEVVAFTPSMRKKMTALIMFMDSKSRPVNILERLS